MKRNKTMLYHINNSHDMARLAKEAKFKYLNHYIGSKGKKYKKIFTRPGFIRFINKLANQPLAIMPIALLGKRCLGVIATQDIVVKKNKIKPLGVYWGELTKSAPAASKYIFTLIKDEVDARKHGNWTRFVNHSEYNTNVTANLKYYGSGKKRLPYMEYGLSKSVKAGEQLLIDYGPDYEFDTETQIFLNPSNSHLTFADIYQLHQENYKLLTGKQYQLCKTLLPTADKIYFPKYLKNSGSELPIITADHRGHIYSDDKQAGLTPLMLAAFAGDVKEVKSLIKYGSNVSQLHIWHGQTPLFYTVQSKAPSMNVNKICRLLLTKETDIGQQDVHGMTVLHWCIKQGHISTLHAIFDDKRVKSNAIDALEVVNKEGYCPALFAIANGDIETAAYLIKLFNRYFKRTFFTSKHHPKILQLFKKIIKQYSADQLKQLYRMLIRNKLAKGSRLARMIRKKLGKF